MWEEILEQPVVLERNLEKNSGTVREIIEAVQAQKVNFVYIAARGTSDHAAVYGKYVMELVTGIPVALAAPSVLTVYHSSLKLKNCLVIAVSQSGKAADALEVIRNANSQGALTVSITNDPNSPLAAESKFHLCCEAGPEKSVAATKTFTAQMFLLAQLAAEWAESEEIKKDLSQVPGKMSQTFEASKIIQEKVVRYRFMDECFILARGINYAISLEAALKIQETTYARAKAFATSDFQHGPIAMVERDIPVMIFAPEGPSLKDSVEIINKLKEKQAELIIISNNKQALSLGTTSFAIPETSNDLISPFFNAVIAQMFACQLSLTKGLNPDSPRGLSKVTITK